MSIFDRIKSAIFGAAHAADTNSATAATATATPAQAEPVSPAAAAPAPTPSMAQAPAPSTPSAGGQPAVGSSTQPVDVAPILDAAVKKSGQKLDWKHSIVDLMKALGMDATLEERKELAAELDYQGDIHDSSKMNTFLHKALLQKLSENGGKVPAELLD